MPTGRPGAQESAVLVDGPWTHRHISANGARFHTAEIGSGPLILLLHGFPEFWWAWRFQLIAFAEAGFRAVAPDLRGYGASDKPPRGYDALTLAADVAGIVRSLGERSAIIVGHDWGGLLGWVVATIHPEAVRGLAVVSTPHPRRLRQAIARDTAQRRAGRIALQFQVPRWPEHWLTTRQATHVVDLLSRWSGTAWPDEETATRYREAMLVPAVAHSSLEYFRWLLRSAGRPDGLRAVRLLDRGVAAPVLHLHGALDRYLLPPTAAGSGQWVRDRYEWVLLDRVGHYPHEEAPDVVSGTLTTWARGVGAMPRRGGDPDRAARRSVTVGEADAAGGVGSAGATATAGSASADGGGRDPRTPGRDRDERGRPRNARPRDPTGRPLPRGAGGDPPGPDGPALPPAEAVAEAERLLAADRPFRAHEVLEAVWKEASPDERELWRGLAQVAVGLTHLQRGNRAGGVALLRRGSDRVAPYAGTTPYQLALDPLVARARLLADRVAAGGPVAVRTDELRFPLRQRPWGQV